MAMHPGTESLATLLQKTKQPEKILHKYGYSHVAGVDEAGRGPLAGPVVAAAVVLPQNWHHAEINDSKKLSAGKRAKLYHIIAEQCLTWNWALAPPEEIDRINILRASLCAMKMAVESLSIVPDYTIVDGPYPVPTPVAQTPIPHGDARSLSIGAASIMAKVVRDAIMSKYHALYPHYNFAQNKGYGTREHLAALSKHGSCPIHRKSFRKAVKLPGF